MKVLNAGLKSSRCLMSKRFATAPMGVGADEESKLQE